MLMNAIYLKTQFLYIVHRICGATVSMLASNGVDCGFEHMSVQTKDYGIHIYCFSAKHTALRRKSKDWLAHNQDNVSEWIDIATIGPLFQCSIIKIQLSMLV